MRKVRIVQALMGVMVGLVMTLTATASPAAAASGGGCARNGPLSSCVSYSSTYKRVSGDFYLDSYTVNRDRACTADLWLNVRGTYHFKYTVAINHLGRFPEAHHSVSGTGNASTWVEIYNCRGHYLAGKSSPTVYYP